MKWLTDKSRLEQSNKCDRWYLIDNELFQDEGGEIYLIPRGYKTDNYTIPNWVAWLGGNKATWDVRPSHLHDFCCQYKQVIRVRLNEFQLRKLRYLKVHKDKIVCDDIPVKYLALYPMTKHQTDSLFKRAMKATGVIPSRIYNLFRFSVFFNLGWLGKHKPYNLENIYKRVD